MKITDLYGKTRFCFNEITGQLGELTTDNSFRSVIPGIADTPTQLLTLLFDADAITDSWNAIDASEFRLRTERYTKTLVGAACAFSPCRA